MSERNTITTDVIVIGGGVLGLAIAARVAESSSVILLEAHGKFGQETSSRNSEVIHSGIYYPKTSKKTAWCLQGREALYAFCKARGVAHLRCGKLLVASVESEQAYLAKVGAHCRDLDVACEEISGAEAQSRIPKIRARSALYFPDSGIVDSHELMAALERLFLERSGTAAYRHRVTSLTKRAEQWQVGFSSDGEVGLIEAPIVINAAGLAAAEVSNLALRTNAYEHRYCRGKYFALSGRFRDQFRHLVYPVPEKHGLGVHVTLDTSGNARLGPDVEWCAESRYADHERWYDCDWETSRPGFVAAVQKYCPDVSPRDLAPGLIGIRPKLFINGTANTDFLVENQDGFIHCLGIESPGLTASIAIAEEVKRLI